MRLFIVIAGLVFATVSCKLRESDSSVVRATPTDQSRVATSILLDQGWDAEERAWFYFSGQGSHLVPYYWFLHLRSRPGLGDENGLFRSNKSLARFGFIPSSVEEFGYGDDAAPYRKYNPDGLPIGMVREVDGSKKTTYLGVTCSLCHTGQVEYQGKKVRIDGGVGRFDLLSFAEELRDTIEFNLEDDVFDELSRNVLADPRAVQEFSKKSDLRKSLIKSRDFFSGYLKRNIPTNTAGPSRVPHVDILTNEMSGSLLQKPGNVVKPSINMKMTSIWRFPSLDWVTVAGGVNDPILRPYLEALGVFARLTLPAEKRFPAIASTVNVPSLFEMHQYAGRLSPPRWPEEVLGKIDWGGGVKRGKALYANNCQSCHELVEGNGQEKPNQLVNVTFVPWDLVRTDDKYLTVVGKRMVEPDETTRAVALQKFPFLGPLLKAEKPKMPAVLFNAILAKMQVGIDLKSLKNRQDLQKWFADLDAENKLYAGIPKKHVDGFKNAEQMKGFVGYRAKPLWGIWATPPYLHNGSVPSLWDLLKPAKDRPDSFKLGGYAYDPSNVGVKVDSGYFSLKVSPSDSQGNANSGHEFGVNLADQEKRDLIEFLKTL